MLNVALVGLLAGSLVVGPTDGDKDKKKDTANDSPRTEANAVPGVFETAHAAQSPETIQDTYAFGRSVTASPIKFWASYAWGESESIWDVTGDEGELAVATSNGDIVTQRVNVGAQIDFLNLPIARIGAGANLTVAKNEFQAGENPSSLFTNGVGDLESDFGLQGLKVYGEARGPVAGVHAGYVFDFGSEREDGEQARALVDVDGNGTLDVELPLSINATGTVRPTASVAGDASFQPLLLPSTLSNSDGRDAINIGADFDYPSERFRLFGGIDYYMLQGIDDNEATAFDESSLDGDDIWNFMFGGGVRFNIFEIGAAAQIQTRHSNPVVENIGTTAGIGGHAGTIAPYIRISPPSIPASLFVKGAVQEEYTEFGYAIGGANSPKPSIGFTAGLTFGFQ